MKPTQFKDRNGKTWDCAINLGKALQVDRSDFTLFTSERITLSRYDQDALKVMLTDNAVLFAIIGVLVRDQCKENFDFEIVDETTEDKFQQEFVKSIDGSCMETARNAFGEALGDFFPAAKTALSTFLGKIDAYREKVSMRLNSEIMPLVDQQMDQVLDEEISRLKKKLRESPNGISSPSLPFSDIVAAIGNP